MFTVPCREASASHFFAWRHIVRFYNHPPSGIATFRCHSSLHLNFTDRMVTQSRVQRHTLWIQFQTHTLCILPIAEHVRQYSALQSAIRAKCTIDLGRVVCRVLSHLRQTEHGIMREPSIFVQHDLRVFFVTRGGR